MAFKLYPAGATTNSDSGVTDFTKCLPTLRAMAEVCELVGYAPFCLPAYGCPCIACALTQRIGLRCTAWHAIQIARLPCPATHPACPTACLPAQAHCPFR